MNTLQMSSDRTFYSIQGEGANIGTRSVFLRVGGCTLDCVFCLGANSYVLTSRGKIKISEVTLSDSVWSFNEKTQKQEFSPVLEVTSHISPDYYAIGFDKGGTRQGALQATGEHPFYVKDRGWVNASDLKVGDVVLEYDAPLYTSNERTRRGSTMSATARSRISEGMRQHNPMHNASTVSQMKATVRSNPNRRNILAEQWTKPEFRELVVAQMRERNPMFDPLVSAKSANRPFGKDSKLELMVNSLIDRHELPLVRNKGKVVIGRRVPDYVVAGTKKVIEVTDPTYLDREENFYAEKNTAHYARHGYDCRTVFIRSSKLKHLETQQNVAGELINHIYNGKTVTRISHVKRPLTVFNLSVENHTFYANGVLTHNCDTAAVWKDTTTMTFDELYSEMAHKGHIEALYTGAHLILTGGSPLRQQKALAEFVRFCYAKNPDSNPWFIEVETEGTLAPKELLPLVALWTVSPKLSNSGMPAHRRCIPSVLAQHVQMGNSIFKFPVTIENIVYELEEIGLAIAFSKIPKPLIWLMPVCSTTKEHERVALSIATIAMQHGYNFSPRLHVILWNQVTGV